MNIRSMFWSNLKGKDVKLKYQEFYSLELQDELISIVNAYLLTCLACYTDPYHSISLTMSSNTRDWDLVSQYSRTKH